MLHLVHMQHTKQYKYKDGVPIRCIAFAIPCAHAIRLSIGPSLRDEHQVPWYISRAAPTDLVKCQHFKRIALIYSRRRQTDGIILKMAGTITALTATKVTASHGVCETFRPCP